MPVWHPSCASTWHSAIHMRCIESEHRLDRGAIRVSQLGYNCGNDQEGLLSIVCVSNNEWGNGDKPDGYRVLGPRTQSPTESKEQEKKKKEKKVNLRLVASSNLVRQSRHCPCIRLGTLPCGHPHGPHRPWKLFFGPFAPPMRALGSQPRLVYVVRHPGSGAGH